MSEDKASAQPESQKAEGGEASKNPLYPDLIKERDRRKTAEAELATMKEGQAEAARQKEVAEAKTADELTALQEKYKAELEAERRSLTIQRDAAQQGINDVFLKDDSASPVEEILQKAKASQDAYNAGVLEAQKTEKMGGGSTPKPGSPKTFTQAQVADPEFYREHREEIMKAMFDGRIVDS